jgi:hypothetical protein
VEKVFSMHIPALLSHNMLRYNDMFDDILSSRNSHLEFVLASEEKRQQVIDQMLSAIINHLNETAIEQAEWWLAAGASHGVVSDRGRKGNGTPSENSSRG